MLIPKAATALALACSLAGLWALAADEPPEPVNNTPLLIIDGAGKEQKVKAWRISAGTRHLTWLAPVPAPKPPPDPKEKPAPPIKGAIKRLTIGPAALEFREEQSTTFVDGVVTLIPLDRIRTIDYDEDKKTVTVKVAMSDKAENDEVLAGTTKFKGINKLTIETEVDKGDLGIAEIKFMGGVAKGIRSLTFPKPKGPEVAPPGRPATITLSDKDKHVQKVHDLVPLYRMPDGSERLVPTLMFKKTLKIDVAKIQKIHVGEGTKTDEGEWTVTLKNGEEHTLTLLKSIPIGDRQGVLEGLISKVPAGYKLYPAHTFSEIVFDEAKKE